MRLIVESVFNVMPSTDPDNESEKLRSITITPVALCPIYITFPDVGTRHMRMNRIQRAFI